MIVEFYRKDAGNYLCAVGKRAILQHGFEPFKAVHASIPQ